MCNDAQLADLVHRIARRDQQALGALYDRLAPSILAQARQILGDHATAEEVTLDTFFKVWRDADRFDVRRGNARTWMITIARSKAVDRWRARRREAATPNPYDLDLAQAVDDPAIGRAREETRTIVHEALSRLPPDERRAVACAFLEGKTHPEVAEALAIPLGTAKSRIRAGLRRLRRLLESSLESHTALSRAS